MAAPMINSHQPLCPDWVFSNCSNVSVAKDRGWFTSYTSFTSHLSAGPIDSDKVAVVGIGTVEIPVRLHSNRKGKKHNTIRIGEVLHVPTSICNVLNQGAFKGGHIISLSSGGGVNEMGRTVACFDERKRLLCLKLSGSPVGPVTTPSRFLKEGANSNQAFWIRADWPASERARYHSIKPYTDNEKEWLKHNFKDEYHFLRQYGLSIYKDTDREEGRAIVRSFIAAEALSSIDSEDGNTEDYASLPDLLSQCGDDDDDEKAFLDELENDPMAPLADYNFTTMQLDWIKEHYKHSGNFLLCHGMKPYNDEDCREGKAILGAMTM